MLHVLFGAVAGAVIGAASVAVTSLVRGKPIDWKSVGSAALGGAAIGAIGAATFGGGLLAGTTVARTTGMVVAGASGGAIEQASDNLLHGRKLSDGVAESAAVGGAIGLFGGGARALRKPLTRLARNPAVRRVTRQLAKRGGALLSKAWQSVKRSPVASALRRKARTVKVNLALGRRSLARATKPITEPIANTTRRFVSDPFKKHVAQPFGKHVSDPFKRRVVEPTKRALAPFAARIGNTRAGQATKKLWGRYMNALEKNPVRTKALTSAGISVTGDLIAQATDDVEGIDLKRTAFRGGFSLLYSGPVGHHWFNAVDKIVPGGGAKAMFTKVLLDQGIMAPVGATVFFSSYGMVLEGEKPGEAFRSAKDDVRHVIPKGWAFWGPFHAVSFSRVPLNLRKPAADAMGLIWSVMFSRIAFQDDDAAAEAPEPTATSGSHTAGPEAGTRRVSNEREANLDGLIDAFTPRSERSCEVPLATSCSSGR
ncbi:MAG: Mpv17/PMP22 family protein [Planctomycetes bacterium]|nr:Mpv17/PMP22 family protein [Planctomycetota bacterium]